MTTSVDDFERRRQARETANERVVCLVVAGSAASLLLTETAWNATLAGDTKPVDQQLIVSEPVEVATVALFLAHVAVLVLLTVRPAYDPRRKYMLVVMRVTLMGFMCWAQWFNRRPSFGLLVPSEMFMMVIVLAGLTFSRGAVLLAGCLSAITYCTMTLLGPVWPLSVRASVLSLQGFGFATAITYYIVGLVSYLAKGAEPLGWPWSAQTTAAAAIPVVALAVWWSLRRLHHTVFKG